MEKPDIVKVLTLDWTGDSAESKKWMKNFNLKAESNTGDHFLKNYKRFLTSRNGCYNDDLENENECIKKLKVRDFSILFKKQQIVDLAKYFHDNGCLAIKICFGLNKKIIDGGQMQLIISGTFWKQAGSLENIEDRLYMEESIVPYFLNFNKKIEPRIFGLYHTNLVEDVYLNDIPQKDRRAVFGYVLSTKTLLSILSKDNHLGKAKTVRFNFGMNSFKHGEEGKGKLLMIKISSPQVKNCNFWLYDTEMPEHDLTTCPPREPCNVPSSI